MFDLRQKSGSKVLVYVERSRLPFERGLWVEIGHENIKEISYYVNANRRAGLQVEKDENGFYRALVLKD